MWSVCHKKYFVAIIFGGSAFISSSAIAQGTCTATQHRTLQNDVDNQCGAALACLGTDNQATLSSKIGQQSRCITARKTINNTFLVAGMLVIIPP
jgi:Novel toxin 16